VQNARVKTSSGTNVLPYGEAGSAGEAGPDDQHAERFELSARVLAIALWLALWMAFGNLVLAIVDGLGEDPVRRFLIGLVLVLSIVAALWKCDAVCRTLQVRPWLVVLVAAAQLAAVIADGPLDTAYAAVSVTCLGLAAIVARARTVWLCVLVLDVGYAAAVLADHSPAMLAHSGELAGALGVLLGYPFAALVVLGLATLYVRFVSNADAIVDRLRNGNRALTPALTQAIQLGAAPPLLLLTAPSRYADLTTKEICAVDALADGRRPKQIAFDWGVSLPTVRKHLAHAKRKTGARTLAELAAMTNSPDWPRVNRAS
jgi:DNA-binding NarL/FixJ family response regulator